MNYWCSLQRLAWVHITCATIFYFVLMWNCTQRRQSRPKKVKWIRCLISSSTTNLEVWCWIMSKENLHLVQQENLFLHRNYCNETPLLTVTGVKVGVQFRWVLSRHSDLWAVSTCSSSNIAHTLLFFKKKSSRWPYSSIESWPTEVVAVTNCFLNIISLLSY